MSCRVRWNQKNHFDAQLLTRKICTSICCPFVKARDRLKLFFSKVLLQIAPLASWGLPAQGEVDMAGQVVLYFEDQADALRFALAAGSVMAGEGAKFTADLMQKTACVTRIRLDAVNAGAGKRSGPDRAA